MIRDELGLSDVVDLTLQRQRDFQDSLEMTGLVLVQLWDYDGNLKQQELGENLVVTAGKNHIADRLSSAPAQAAMGWMAIGTGSSAPAAGDTLLGTETDRNACTSITDATNVVTYVGDWAAGDGTSAVLREAGIFNIVTANTVTMLARHVYSNIDKGAGDTLKITWTVTVG